MLHNSVVHDAIPSPHNPFKTDVSLAHKMIVSILNISDTFEKYRLQPCDSITYSEGLDFCTVSKGQLGAPGIPSPCDCKIPSENDTAVTISQAIYHKVTLCLQTS